MGSAQVKKTQGVGLSQQEVAERLGISRARVQQIEDRAIAKMKKLLVAKYGPQWQEKW